MNRTDKKINELTMKNDNFKDKRSGKKDIERAVTVALSRTRIPFQPQGLDRKNTIVGKCRGAAGCKNNNLINYCR